MPLDLVSILGDMSQKLGMNPGVRDVLPEKWRGLADLPPAVPTGDDTPGRTDLEEQFGDAVESGTVEGFLLEHPDLSAEDYARFMKSLLLTLPGNAEVQAEVEAAKNALRAGAMAQGIMVTEKGYKSLADLFKNAITPNLEEDSPLLDFNVFKRLTGLPTTGKIEAGTAIDLGGGNATTTYEGQEGDTMASVAARFGFPIASLLAANPGYDQGDSIAGAEINLPTTVASSKLPLVGDVTNPGVPGGQRMGGPEETVPGTTTPPGTEIPGEVTVDDRLQDIYARTSSPQRVISYLLGDYDPFMVSSTLQESDRITAAALLSDLLTDKTGATPFAHDIEAMLGKQMSGGLSHEYLTSLLDQVISSGLGGSLSPPDMEGTTDEDSLRSALDIIQAVQSYGLSPIQRAMQFNDATVNELINDYRFNVANKPGAPSFADYFLAQQRGG